MTEQERLVMLARAAAFRHKLDPALVCAIAHHESAGWQTWASRYEPAFYKRYIENLQPPAFKRFGRFISEETERKDRATSFGLMQVMGQVARERGFTGEWLTELMDPQVGLEYGCRQLARKLANANNDRDKALLAYNGGANPQYPRLVMEHYPKYA